MCAWLAADVGNELNEPFVIIFVFIYLFILN